MILAFDVSNSMRAKDLEPSRIEAAKAAARAFVERQPSTIKIGVVAFGDSAVTVLRPSNVKEDVLAAINRLSVERRHVARPGPLHVAQHHRGQAAEDRRVGARRATPATSTSATSARRRSCSSRTGRTRSSPTRSALAEVASTAGVNVHAIGVGTEEGTVVQIDGFNVATALDAGC